jgi:hypothetical protein
MSETQEGKEVTEQATALSREERPITADLRRQATELARCIISGTIGVGSGPRLIDARVILQFDAALREAEQDARRLNWLESRFPTLPVDVWDFGGHKFTGPTWREAIDVALASTPDVAPLDVVSPSSDGDRDG